MMKFTKNEIYSTIIALVTGAEVPTFEKKDGDTPVMVTVPKEAIIDRMLFQNKIPFHYEEKLVLDGIILYPDFVIRHPITGQYFYWEHLGMMDNPDYCKHACDKIKLYCQHGIIPSVNLILTYETKQYPLSADKVERILQEYFGCSIGNAVIG